MPKSAMAWPTWRRRRLASFWRFTLVPDFAGGSMSSRVMPPFYRPLPAAGVSFTPDAPPGGAMLQPPDPARITSQLVELRCEHRDLDAAIARLDATHDPDDLAIKRLKKRK